MSLVIVYVILFADNRFDLWPRLGLDYSTHTAFAVAIITSLTVVSRRWLLLLIPILVGYAALMMYLGYHSLEGYPDGGTYHRAHYLGDTPDQQGR